MTANGSDGREEEKNTLRAWLQFLFFMIKEKEIVSLLEHLHAAFPECCETMALMRRRHRSWMQRSWFLFFSCGRQQAEELSVKPPKKTTLIAAPAEGQTRSNFFSFFFVVVSSSASAADAEGEIFSLFCDITRGWRWKVNDGFLFSSPTHIDTEGVLVSPVTFKNPYSNGKF